MNRSSDISTCSKYVAYHESFDDGIFASRAECTHEIELRPKPFGAEETSVMP
jgi:hypothetical protein